MYTSYIGAKFLEIYNRRESKNYSAEEFFDKVLFPAFFEDERHLMHVFNSSFFQKVSKNELSNSRLSKSEFQFKRLKEIIDAGAVHAGTYAGSWGDGPHQTTAGQVTNICIDVDKDEMYASWIGNALSIRVEGSQCLLIDSEPVLWHLFEGWKVYRKYMEPLNRMKGRQIETWNGYWLAKGDLSKAPHPPIKGDKLDTYPWLEVIARILHWHGGEIMPVYVFSLGQTNITYGFINIHLPELKRLQNAHYNLKRATYAVEEGDETFWQRYVPEFHKDFTALLAQGEIGINGLAPKHYVTFLAGNLSPSKSNSQLFANIETYILAMLNNRADLQEVASELASKLSALDSTDGKGKRAKAHSDKYGELFAAKGITSFINALTECMDKNPEIAPTCKLVVDKVLSIPIDSFPLFKALLRFEYVANSQSN